MHIANTLSYAKTACLNDVYFSCEEDLRNCDEAARQSVNGATSSLIQDTKRNDLLEWVRL